ncbi:hypothetical protein JST97_34685 [bacterium]|nr:hypothetical protein [bacterium]
MAIGISRFAPLLTQPPAKTAPVAQSRQAGTDAPTGNDGSVNGAQSAASSASNLLQGLVGAYAPKLSLTPEQMQEIKEAAPTLQKLAGADGKWGPSDLADNVEAVGGRFLQRTLVESQLRKGFEEMTGKPVPKLTDEEKTAARERWQSLSPEDRKERRISVEQLKQVGGALNSVKESTPLSKLAPKSDGISGDMLQRLGEKQQPNVMDLMQAQKPSSEAAPETSPPPAASAADAPAGDSPAGDPPAGDAAPPQEAAPPEQAPPPEPAAPDQP